MEENGIQQNSTDKPSGSPSGGILKDILAVINSDDTASKIAEICIGHEIKDEAIVKEIGSETAKVLIGKLTPKDFEKALKGKLRLSSFLASKIAREISESIFYQVKESLSVFYGDDALSLEPANKEGNQLPEEKYAHLETITEDSEFKKEASPEAPRRSDTYRESIE